MLLGWFKFDDLSADSNTHISAIVFVFYFCVGTLVLMAHLEVFGSHFEKKYWDINVTKSLFFHQSVKVLIRF